jgi:four helix bundle protein
VAGKIENHTDLQVYLKVFGAAPRIFELSKSFPKEATYALTDQLRRSSRSVCANLAEGWRKRRYAAMFISKLADAEGEAAETQVWLEFAVKCKCLKRDEAASVYAMYREIVGTLVNMINRPESWVSRKK